MKHYDIKLNFQDGGKLREAELGGRKHLIVPVVMIVEGVLNGSLLLVEEFGAFPESWNGIPVPISHPEIDGRPISANQPHVYDSVVVGTIYNTKVDGKRLVSEIWLDVQKAERLGYAGLVEALSDGFAMEVSTGYYSDDEEKPGEYNGVPYSMVHRNIRPDHLALLPGEIGACSLEDGCGTHNNSKKRSMILKVNDAFATLAKALGMNPKTNCQCEEHMDIIEKAKALVKANKLDAKQLAAIQEMAEEDRKLLAAFIGALESAPGTTEEPGEMMEEEELPDAMEDDKEAKNMSKKKAPVTMSKADVDRLIANGVKEHLRRADVVSKLTANEKNTFTEDQMAAMSVDQLEAVEKMIRPADYSGAGAFSAHSHHIDANVTPMVPRGVLSKKKEA